MRSYAREVAFAKIYQKIVGGNFSDDFEMFDEKSLDEEDKQFALSLAQTTLDHTAHADEIIERFARGYKLERIYKIDLAIMQLALCEMDFTDTPAPVVINEAVSIAKKYSTEKSVSFVNGILGAYLRSKNG